MDDYVKIFIDFDALENSAPNKCLSISYLDRLIERIEIEDAVAAPSYGMDNNYESRFLGINAWMLDKVYERLKEELEATYGAIKCSTIQVRYDIETFNRVTPDLVKTFEKQGITIEGYSTIEFKYGTCKRCFSFCDRINHSMDKLERENEQVWFLCCRSENSSDFKRLFGTDITLIKTQKIDEPRIYFAITKGPKLSNDLNAIIRSIDLHVPYGL